LGSSACSRFDTRQFSVLAVALLWAILLLSLAPGAKGEAAAQPMVAEDPSGAPYVAGELLVAYEPGTSAQTEQAVVRRSGGRTAKHLSGEIRLVSFPHLGRKEPAAARERALQARLDDLRDDPGVVAADYNYIRTAAAFLPNDPRFGGQWGLKKPAFPGAWDFARGAGAKIAIIDSGIAQNHPDIGKISAQTDYVSDDAVANDPYGHGTHVAGIAAALTNNGRGVAGGCPRCELLVARVLNANGDGTDADIIDGIGWSVRHGADVINLSFARGQRSSVLETKINSAYANGNGAVIVAAAGNEGLRSQPTLPQYPAAYGNVIAVSATNQSDGLASFSSRGSWVDLAAPGTDILSTGAGGGYYKESGTSEAAPFVSALAGLLASKGKTASEIRQRMQSSATDLGASGFDPKVGHGRINARRALTTGS
jgi:thermitase